MRWRPHSAPASSWTALSSDRVTLTRRTSVIFSRTNRGPSRRAPAMLQPAGPMEHQAGYNRPNGTSGRLEPRSTRRSSASLASSAIRVRTTRWADRAQTLIMASLGPYMPELAMIMKRPGGPVSGRGAAAPYGLRETGLWCPYG